MNYSDALKYIHSIPKLDKSLGNSNLEQVMKHLGNPEKSLKFVHIAGTNGKGSTSAMTERVLRSAGYKTGMFTSPYIERFNERIKINGTDIDDETIAVLTERLKNVIETLELTIYEFAFIFVMGMVYFKEQNCDVVILETGLGGRLDATNIIENPLVCAITSVGYDHMQYLGNTLPEIAFEKAGIIKNNSAIVVYPCAVPEVKKVIEVEARKKGAYMHMCSDEMVRNKEIVYDGCTLKLNLDGDYQFSNATVTLEILNVLRENGYNISTDDVKGGFENVQWPGRFEWISDKIILDGCHNAEGAESFVKSISKYEKPITVVVGMMKDKDCISVCKILSSIADSIITTKPDISRAVEAGELKEMFNELGREAIAVSSSEEAVTLALKNDGICAVCGSLYLIGEVRSLFK